MRLMNTSTFEVKQFYQNVPEYAILSHTWDEVELTLQDLLTNSFKDSASFQKVKGCCEQARRHGWQWAWIDSCCIDKTSSAELSEAINSMFKWYEEAQVCYVYLSDVTYGFINSQEDQAQFRNSRWFTRGWTLQELLAPSIVIFYDSTWARIGSRDGHQDDAVIVLPAYFMPILRPLIIEITGIRELNSFRNASIACKMSWAASRNTTREEDHAYSLLGLFNINMPPLYGEGSKAFYRLQLEILNNSDDESIFAWADSEDTHGGLLAPSIEAFAFSGDIIDLTLNAETKYNGARLAIGDRPPYMMTNKGLHISCSSLTYTGNADNETQIVIVPIHCVYGTLSSVQNLCLYLARVDRKKRQWTRIFSDRIMLLDESQQHFLQHSNVDNLIQQYYIRQMLKSRVYSIPDSVKVVVTMKQIHGVRYVKHIARQESQPRSITWTSKTQCNTTISVQPLDSPAFRLTLVVENDDASRWASVHMNRNDDCVPWLEYKGPYTSVRDDALNMAPNSPVNLQSGLAENAMLWPRWIKCDGLVDSDDFYITLTYLRRKPWLPVYGYGIEFEMLSKPTTPSP